MTVITWGPASGQLPPTTFGLPRGGRAVVGQDRLALDRYGSLSPSARLVPFLRTETGRVLARLQADRWSHGAIISVVGTLTRRASEEAISLGHHWVGEEHVLLALVGGEPWGDPLLDPIGPSRDEVALAVADLTDAVGPPFAREFRGCISAPSYHTVLGRAHGFAVGSGQALPGPADFLAALLWDPAASPSRLLEMVGRTRLDAIRIAAGTGRMVPVAPAVNALLDPAEREAVALGYSFVGDNHVVLALLSGAPDDQAGRALRSAGASHDRLAGRMVEMSLTCEPPTVLSSSVASAKPNPRCRQLLGRAEGLSAMLGQGLVGSVHGLAAYLWQNDGQPMLMLEALGVSVPDLLAGITDLGGRWPSVALPEPDRTPWGEKVYVPSERMDEVIARLKAVLPRGYWGFNCHAGSEWVVAHATIDLSAIVAEVLAS